MNPENREVLDIFLSFGLRYGPAAGPEGPVLLVREVFGADPDPWQEQVLRWFGGQERRISVRSGHGVGKSCVAAWLVWCSLLTRFPQKTRVTAPSAGQIEAVLWPEVLKWGKKLPPQIFSLFNVKNLRIELAAAPEESFFEAKTSRADNPEALQGVHCDPGYVLLIADEASGVPEPVYNSAGGSMSDKNATMVLIGNPTRTSGLFFDSHNSASSIWKTIRVGHEESPRISKDFVNQIRMTHGEDSNEFRVRCLGEFPLSDSDTIVSWELVNSARERTIKEDHKSQRVWGLDVARYGDNSTVLCERTNRAVTFIDSWSKQNTMETAGRVKAKWDNTLPYMRPIAIFVDAIGVGGGVADRLIEMGLPAVAINVSEVASVKGKHKNLRSELYWRAREWLESKAVRLPKPAPNADKLKDPAERLVRELVAVKYKYTSDGKLLVQSKDDMKKEMKNLSPDHADAFVLTFAEEAALAGGYYGGMGRNEPITRQVAIV